MQHYSNPDHASDLWKLPDVEIFQLTAREVAERDEDLIYEYLHRHEFRLATMNSRTRDKMFDAMIEEHSIKGGWFFWFCVPGCMPDSDAFGPYPTAKAAALAANEMAGE